MLAALIVGPGQPCPCRRAPPAAAETAGDSETDSEVDPEAEKEEQNLDYLRALVKRQQALLEQQAKSLEEQQGRLDEQATQIAAQQELLDDQARAIQELMARLDQVEPREGDLTEAEIALLERVDQLEKEMESDPGKPADDDSAGDFKGSIRVPGTKMAFRLGGFVATNIVFNSEELAHTDRFVTAEIPVPQVSQVSVTSFNVNVRRSRINYDWRMDSSVGRFRAFIEGDFLGDGNAFRLRHAYGQYKDMVLGQTWSTFSDPHNDPEEIDLEGINGQVLLRQPLARFRWRPRRGFERALGLENPSPDVTGGTGLTQIPDIVYRFSRDREESSIHMAAILRLIRAERDSNPGETSQALGLGATVSGTVPSRWRDRGDEFIYQVNLGRGLGRYITDLAAEGGQDAWFDPESGDLEALDVFAGLVSYRHNWPLEWREVRSLRTTATFGWVNVRNLDFQPDDAYDRTYRLGITTFWSPIPRLDLGVEFLWGRRVNKDGETGTAGQVQFASYFRF